MCSEHKIMTVLVVSTTFPLGAGSLRTLIKSGSQGLWLEMRLFAPNVGPGLDKRSIEPYVGVISWNSEN
jgi:hypothetical protein